MKIVRTLLPVVLTLIVIGAVFHPDEMKATAQTESNPQQNSATTQAESDKTEFECRFASGPIAIDGKANDKAWQAAEVIDHFYLPWLQDKARAAKTATKAKLLWDRENLYFFAELEDHDLFADIQEHDGKTWFNDVFELFFKPATDKPGYYEFHVSAAGTVMDAFLPQRGDGGFDKHVADGDFHIAAKVIQRGTLNQRQ
ncbi:MAG: carbohydrate-binding family 9-like protein, partial [Planctomycetes bacterium]|nr:carbohydrate-binding family 9-like protein [Planctomycetota bacterium]